MSCVCLCIWTRIRLCIWTCICLCIPATSVPVYVSLISWPKTFCSYYVIVTSYQAYDVMSTSTSCFVVEIAWLVVQCLSIYDTGLPLGNSLRGQEGFALVVASESQIHWLLSSQWWLLLEFSDRLLDMSGRISSTSVYVPVGIQR